MRWLAIHGVQRTARPTTFDFGNRPSRCTRLDEFVICRQHINNKKPAGRESKISLRLGQDLGALLVVLLRSQLVRAILLEQFVQLLLFGG